MRWQIRNERLEGSKVPKGIDYQDIRDDRINSYFSLWRQHYWYHRYTGTEQDAITIKVILNASFAGKFFLPATHVEAMYNNDIYANTLGQWVEVVAQ